ncbi:hypothetical protein F7725_008561, partial [Dissostichus mawsoni]
MEREQRARRYYELQIQERRKKLLDQRLKEERKRAAVEEKRKQRLKEDKERYESAVRRTVEKSQRAQQSQNSRGRKLTKNRENKTNMLPSFSPFPLNPNSIFNSFCATYLNNSWTCLLSFFCFAAPYADQYMLVPRRLPLTPWEKNLVIRLLTHMLLSGRSKSAGFSFHSMNSTTNSTPHKPSSSTTSPPFPPTTASTEAAIWQIEASSQKDTKKKNSNTKSPAVSTSVKPAKVTLSRTTSPSPE